MRFISLIFILLFAFATATAQNFAELEKTMEVFARDGKLFIKEDGKDFELTRTGRNNFSYEQGEVLFVENEKGEIEHIFMGLYAARKVSVARA